MLVQRFNYAGCVTAVFSVFFATAAQSGGSFIMLEPEPVKSLSKLFEGFDPDSDVELNLSGAVCLSPSNCIAVSDELIAVQQVMFDATDVTYSAGASFADLFEDHCKDPGTKEECVEWDLEGVARSDDRIYVTGSMGLGRNSAKKDEDRWVVAAFQVNDQGLPKPATLEVQHKRMQLKRLFSDEQTDLSGFVDAPLQCGGVNVEGLGYRNGSLFFGLRSPSVRNDGRAYIIEVDANELIAGSKDDPLRTSIHEVTFREPTGSPVENVGIRAIESLGDTLVIATADAGVGDVKPKRKRVERREEGCKEISDGEHTNTEAEPRMTGRLWVWAPDSGDPRPLAELDGPYRHQKLEGVAIVNSDGSEADLLLVFDDPENDLSSFGFVRGVALPQ